MFYSVFVLGKKGPLARVWLAAHWDKKITKAQILETNIVESVDSILQPRVKLSLRTSSHLLLGIVRIYARKTLYLLQDCQDAAFKIKSAFRPGAVDLPDGKTEAAVSAITLPEMLDFVDDFDLIAEPPIQIEHLQTNTNIRSITLVEDISSMQVDDPILGEVRDWSDYSSVQGASTSKDLNDSSMSGTQTQKGSHPLDIFDRPPIDDGFGAPLGIGDVDDMFALPVPPEAHAEQGEENKDKGDELERPLSRLSDRSDSMSYGAPASIAPSGPPSTPGSVPPPPIEDQEMEEMPQIIPPASASRMSELEDKEELRAEHIFRKPGTQESMVLEPLEGPGFERRRKRRKKLGIIIDEVKTLSGEEMKAQLSNASDIITTLDLAPPSKKLMHWKKTGGSEKLFALSERQILSKLLLVYYTRHLTTNRIQVEEELPEMINGDEFNKQIDDRRGDLVFHENLDMHDEQFAPPISPLKEIQPPKTPRTPRREVEHRSPVKKKRKVAEDKEKPERKSKNTFSDISDRINNHPIMSEMSDNSIPVFRAGSIQNSSVYHQDPSINFQSEYQDDDNYDQYDQPMSVGPVSVIFKNF